jgi:hypothetical protein
MQFITALLAVAAAGGDGVAGGVRLDFFYSCPFLLEKPRSLFDWLTAAAASCAGTSMLRVSV